jgi:4'-phosphopantetheinyl transferase
MIFSGSDLWNPGPSAFHLNERSIHIWSAGLAMPPRHVAALARNLSSDDGQRAQRFRFEDHRRRFIVGRGLLRAILGRYLAMDPDRIRLGYGPHGKPMLLEDQTIQFNVSHAHEMVMFGFSRGHAIGVDIEQVKPVSGFERIAERFFSPQEYTSLQSLPAQERLLAFLSCWTRKEAFIKALGEGLSYPLHQFDVSLAPDVPARLLAVADNPDEASRWTLLALEPGPDYIGAVAVATPDVQLSCLNLEQLHMELT